MYSTFTSGLRFAFRLLLRFGRSGQGDGSLCQLPLRRPPSLRQFVTGAQGRLRGVAGERSAIGLHGHCDWLAVPPSSRPEEVAGGEGGAAARRRRPSAAGRSSAPLGRWGARLSGRARRPHALPRRNPGVCPPSISHAARSRGQFRRGFKPADGDRPRGGEAAAGFVVRRKVGCGTSPEYEGGHAPARSTSELRPYGGDAAGEFLDAPGAAGRAGSPA